jgi:hypothetical protein
MAVLYQLSYVGAEGNRIAAASGLSGAVGKPDRRMLTQRRPPRAGFVPIYSPRRHSVSRCSSISPLRRAARSAAVPGSP